MTIGLLLVGGWIILSFATAGAIAWSAMRREPGLGRPRGLDVPAALRLRSANDLDAPSPHPGTADVHVGGDDDRLLAPQVCVCCGRASTSVREPRRAG